MTVDFRWALRCIVLGLGITTATARGATAQLLAKKVDPMLDSRTIGDVHAPVTVYEMSDFQCPWCRRHVLESWPAIQKEYVSTGKVRFIFINFPLTQLHPNAAAAAEFAMCAAKSNGFWKIHDLLYQYQDKWAPLQNPAPFLLSLADTAKLPRKAIEACLTSGEMKEVVQADAEGAAHAGARSTPSFLTEGGIVAGFLPIEKWRPILDTLIALKKK
ncbi:MAG: DsbA family protein [Gemmatimonadota bacterium]